MVKLLMPAIARRRDISFVLTMAGRVHPILRWLRVHLLGHGFLYYDVLSRKPQQAAQCVDIHCSHYIVWAVCSDLGDHQWMGRRVLLEREEADMWVWRQLSVTQLTCHAQCCMLRLSCASSYHKARYGRSLNRYAYPLPRESTGRSFLLSSR